jgi:dihydrofolate reductase
MPRPLWHCHIAMSLDGRIARADGSFDWLFAYPPREFGIDAFHAAIGAVVMGRATYDIERAMESWPHRGRQVFVVTSRPIADPPPGVEAWTRPLEELVRRLDSQSHDRIGIEGGGQLIRGLIGLGRLDVLEMAIVPLVLGEGIPLFAPGTPELGLELSSCAVRTGGALHVVYRRSGEG